MSTNHRSIRLSSLALAALVLVPAVAAAQTAPLTTFGVKAGVNVATLSSEDSTAELGQKIGLVGGVFVGRSINDRFAMRAEGLFSQRGAKQTIGSIENDVTLTYFDLPLLAVFGNTTTEETRFNVFTGPQASFLVSAKDDFGGFNDDEVKGVDFGWTLGAGVERGRASLDVRYTLGLTNADNSASDASIKNRTFAVMVGYRLK